MKKIILLLIALIFSLNAMAAEDEKWNIAKSTHFILYYKEIPTEFVDEVLSRCEGYYNKITEALGFTRFNFWLWDNRAKIYVYNDAEEYRARTAQPSWSSGCVSISEKVIKTFPLASGFFDTLLPHELGHIIFREFVGFYNQNITLWLDEGVASYQEMSKRFAAKGYVRRALKDNTFMPLARLSQVNLSLVSDPATVTLFYSESVSVVDYLISKFGSSEFVNFCRALRDGKTLEEAISRTYPFKDLSGLNAGWVQYLQNG